VQKAGLWERPWVLPSTGIATYVGRGLTFAFASGTWMKLRADVAHCEALAVKVVVE